MREFVVESSLETPKFNSNVSQQSDITTISELYNNLNNKWCTSVELCSNRGLNTTLLAEINPVFCSVTWHYTSEVNSGNINEIPAIILTKQLRESGYNVLLHLPGGNLNENGARTILEKLQELGVKNILVLQGDKYEDNPSNKRDFPYAIDLVGFIKKHYKNCFCLGVAGYPEQHPSSESIQADIFYLKQKASEADFIITQACFDYEGFKKFTTLCRNSSITIPIIPGVFVINSYQAMIGMMELCAVPIPKHILTAIEEIKNDGEAVRKLGIKMGVDYIQRLIEDPESPSGIIHVFSLNDISVVKTIVDELPSLQK